MCCARAPRPSAPATAPFRSLWSTRWSLSVACRGTRTRAWSTVRPSPCTKRCWKAAAANPGRWRCASGWTPRARGAAASGRMPTRRPVWRRCASGSTPVLWRTSCSTTSITTTNTPCWRAPASATRRRTASRAKRGTARRGHARSGRTRWRSRTGPKSRQLWTLSSSSGSGSGSSRARTTRVVCKERGPPRSTSWRGSGSTSKSSKSSESRLSSTPLLRTRRRAARARSAPKSRSAAVSRPTTPRSPTSRRGRPSDRTGTVASETPSGLLCRSARDPSSPNLLLLLLRRTLRGVSCSCEQGAAPSSTTACRTTVYWTSSRNCASREPASLTVGRRHRPRRRGRPLRMQTMALLGSSSSSRRRRRRRRKRRRRRRRQPSNNDEAPSLLASETLL
mmetsp:Transcript_6378/g.19939  ORF Transcript_6378/g.19939 Transcript_6378/m.19939 type:complete len:393 (-) Transcript_6378:127-1305(-)